MVWFESIAEDVWLIQKNARTFCGVGQLISTPRKDVMKQARSAGVLRLVFNVWLRKRGF